MYSSGGPDDSWPKPKASRTCESSFRWWTWPKSPRPYAAWQPSALGKNVLVRVVPEVIKPSFLYRFETGQPVRSWFIPPSNYRHTGYHDISIRNPLVSLAISISLLNRLSGRSFCWVCWVYSISTWNLLHKEQPQSLQSRYHSCRGVFQDLWESGGDRRDMGKPWAMIESPKWTCNGIWGCQ